MGLAPVIVLLETAMSRQPGFWEGDTVLDSPSSPAQEPLSPKQRAMGASQVSVHASPDDAQPPDLVPPVAANASHHTAKPPDPIHAETARVTKKRATAWLEADEANGPHVTGVVKMRCGSLSLFDVVS